ncbi:polyadenylate-binding protein-interacting protein 1 [Sitophilus oryzae]|uniref:Polyadenylate-binding protein-interacting protein 1 n=1 Tax=Sitophilus oryzae TaxID=7048 RepID=A0A6J2YTH0_SITOR|nr:polyadenylate-binding protein-interacting protein 1 [Sitophilus oryzae]
MEKEPHADPLWQKKTSVQKPMRLPKDQQTGAASTPSLKIDVEQSTLKPDAPEFIPQSVRFEQLSQSLQQNVVITNQTPKSHAQNRIALIRNSKNNEPNNHEYSDYEHVTNGYGNDESLDMLRLRQIISSLIKYPGQFDDLLMVFMETIYPYFDDILAMSEITNLMVNEAITCPNFRYNGARLCWYVEQKCPSFRADLHLKCQKALNDHTNKQNVVLFIAELYTQLPHDSLYGALLVESFKKLLTSGGDDNVKCICQALKLTGYSLEQNNKQALDDLFAQLRLLKNTIKGSALTLLVSVINLRESNWGRGSTESPHSSDYTEYDHDYEEMVKGILYESNGEVLTNEENEFLAAYATNSEYLIDNEDPDALCDPEPEMDEEIQAAFQEFVKLSKG